MSDYTLEQMDEKRRQGRPSAIYRTILVDFLARPDAKSRVVVGDKSHLTIAEGLRVAKKNSTLFDPIAIERVGEDVFLSKDRDFWDQNRRRD
jgi:hypothetical protein